jgi:hypothetical protein
MQDTGWMSNEKVPMGSEGELEIRLRVDAWADHQEGCAGGIGNLAYHTFCIGREEDVPAEDVPWFCYFCAIRDGRENVSLRGYEG